MPGRRPPCVPRPSSGPGSAPTPCRKRPRVRLDPASPAAGPRGAPGIPQATGTRGPTRGADPVPEAHANASLSQAWLVHDDTGAGSTSHRPRRHDFEFLRLNRRNADKMDLAGGFYESHRVKNPRAWPATRDRPTEASAAPASPLAAACYRLRPFLLRRSGRLRMGWPRAETLVFPS